MYRGFVDIGWKPMSLIFGSLTSATNTSVGFFFNIGSGLMYMSLILVVSFQIHWISSFCNYLRLRSLNPFFFDPSIFSSSISPICKKFKIQDNQGNPFSSPCLNTITKDKDSSDFSSPSSRSYSILPVLWAGYWFVVCTI